MQKNIIVLFLFFISIISNFCYTKNVFSYNEYAKINNSTYLYKTPSNELDYSNVICKLDETYFVKIENEYNDEFYKISYNGIYGYVLKQHLILAKETPTNPYPNIELTITTKCYLRSTPENTNNSLLSINSNTNVSYIGTISGDEIMDFEGNIWYFVNYLGITGYIYNGYIEDILIVPPNTEEIALFTVNNFKSINPLSDRSCIILIIITTIPLFAILILLFKKPKTNKITPPKIVRENDKIDYDTLL